MTDKPLSLIPKVEALELNDINITELQNTPRPDHKLTIIKNNTNCEKLDEIKETI